MIGRIHLLDILAAGTVMLVITVAVGLFFAVLAVIFAVRRLGKMDLPSRDLLMRRLIQLFVRRALFACCLGIGAGLILYLVMVLVFTTPTAQAALGFALFPMIFVSQAWVVAFKAYPRTVNQSLIDAKVQK